MKILVTGSTGLVGSEAVKFFRNLGHEVVGVDNNMRSYFFATPSKVAEVSLDIRDAEAVNALIKDGQFDALIHAAAQPSHDWSKQEPITDFDVNARATLLLLEAVRRHSPQTIFVHCSTDKIYGEGMKRNLIEFDTRYHSSYPFDEITGVDQSVHSLFGVSKLAADMYVQEYGFQFGMKTVCFRCGCITGSQHEGAEQHGFLAYLVKCIKEGIPYKIFGYKGKQVRDIIHAYDLVNAMWHFIQNPKVAAVYNMGGGKERSVSILEAIDLIERKLGKRAITEIVPEERFGDRQWDVHDVDKFKQDYPHWEYDYSLDDIMNNLCQS
jgi:CDP-paratose 2-epimerase